MELKEQYEDILLLGKELSFYILETLLKEEKKAYEVNDIEKVKSIRNNFIPKFEKFYFEFSLELPEEFSKEEIEKTEEIVYKLIEEYNLDEELLWDRVRKRLEIFKESASNSVKTMFEIQLKEMEKNLNILLSKEKEFLVTQRDLERELADCIQADEEMIVFEKLSEHGKKLDDIDKKIIKLEEKIQEIKYNIQSEWPYEIYGLIKKEDLYDKVKDFNKN